MFIPNACKNTKRNENRERNEKMSRLAERRAESNQVMTKGKNKNQMQRTEMFILNMIIVRIQPAK